VAGDVDLLLLYVGEASPFRDWLDSLKDGRAVGVIRARLNRIRLGNFGDCHAVGEGVEELRLHFGPGYRIYFGREGLCVVILLIGGSKKSQGKDIVQAKKLWKEYRNAKSADKNKALSRRLTGKLEKPG
jgi:putative addiction module killer protein